MPLNCEICLGSIKKNIIKIRGDKKKKIYICKNCDYEFIKFPQNKLLEENKLDNYRLSFAGLKIPNFKKDFYNGVQQSKEYITKYLRFNKKKLNILEIGCSWGYFLKTIKKKNNVFGLEINKLRREYVNKKLNIKCYNDIINIKKKNIKLDRIFLFYSIQYIKNPSNYISDLYGLLKKNGKIIILTPNKNDGIKNLWKNKKYTEFIYDNITINYFSLKSFEKLLKKLKIKNYKIKTINGYSLFNHINWYINKKPLSSNRVGRDQITEHLKNNFKMNDAKSKKLFNKLKKFSNEYKLLLEKFNLGNQIELIINK